MQDVVPPSDRSIRNIPLPAHRRKSSFEAPSSAVPPPRTPRPPQTDPGSFYQEPPKARGSRVMWFLAVALVGILIAVGAAILLEGATVTVMPRKATATLPETLIAYADAPLGSLPFTTATTEASASRTVSASGERDVARQASGTIRIENTYSTATQRLIKNTRFEAPDGKIYRINESVVVPGAKKNADGSLSAGTIEAIVFADSAGPSYDRGLDTYTIPGFKGDPRYEKFSAKGVTPIVGGFVGKEKIVPDEDRKAAEEGIKAELADSLAAALIAAAPADRMLVDGSVSVTYVPVQTEATGGASEATITLKGEATGAFVKESELASAVAKAAIAGYGGEAVAFIDRASVGIKAKEAVTAATKELHLAGVGTADILWQFDPAAIQQLLAGIPENMFVQTLTSAGPAIADGKASLKPFWKKTFPSNPADIKVKVGEPTEAK